MRTALALVLVLLAAPAAQADAVEATTSARVAATPERVLAVLGDFESWGRVFVSVETLAAERRGEGGARLRQRVRCGGYTLAYTLSATVDLGARRVDLVLDPSEPSEMAELVSSWRVVPDPSGGSIVTLRVLSRSKLPVPSFVERRIAERSAHTSLAELVHALEQVAASPERVGQG